MIRKVERERGVLLDQQHAHPVLLIDGAQDAEDFLHDEGREPERGLVEQQQFRAQHQRAADRQHLLLATRERACLLFHPLLQAWKVVVDQRKIARDAGPIATGMGAEPQVLLGRELEKGAAAIGYVRDAAARNLLGSLAIDAAGVEADFSLRPDHPAHGAQGRGLAGAVGAEDAW